MNNQKKTKKTTFVAFFNYKSGEQEGLISVDRSNKATLLLTIPCSLFKSYAKDLPPQTFQVIINKVGPNLFCLTPTFCYMVLDSLLSL